MKKINYSPIKIAFVLMAGLFFISFNNAAVGQQSVIANKDNTRPEMDRLTGSPVTVENFSALPMTGYNEVRWNVSSGKDIRRFIVEYSLNGLDYQTAAEVLPSGTQYALRHPMTTNKPMLYRIRTEQVNGATRYSVAFFLGGDALPPVTIYPTVVSGNMLNVNAGWPIERVTIISGDGTQVYSKEVNGQKDLIPISLPSLAKGMYWVAFFGNGWRTTQKILVS